MTHAFAMPPQALKRVLRTERSNVRTATRRQKRTAQTEKRQIKRREEVEERIYTYVTSQDKELIHTVTLDCLIDELMSANIAGESRRERNEREIVQAFREIQDVILGGVPGLTLHIEVGVVLLGVKEAYWPMTPFSPYGDDGMPAFPEHMLSRCLRGKRTLHEY